MKVKEQSGFSLIELLLVVTIIAIIAAIGVPSLQKAIMAADNGATFGVMRSISSTQMSFYSQNSRYGRLNELNAMMGNGLGTPSGTSLVRGRFTFDMMPATDDELKSIFTITATGVSSNGSIPYVFRLNQTGEIRQVTP